MQPGLARATPVSPRSFNPHPTPRPSATLPAPRRRRNESGRQFQSSPKPEAGCNLSDYYFTIRVAPWFQSSPDPEAGCNGHRVDAPHLLFVVSILAQARARDQPTVFLGVAQWIFRFQSSPDPKIPVQPARMRLSRFSGRFQRFLLTPDCDPSREILGANADLIICKLP